MDFRVPLTYVFQSALSQRHAIPHRTLYLEVTHPFINYLESNDTRLPHHPALIVQAQPAEVYETYVGEDDWHHDTLSNNTIKDNNENISNDSSSNDPLPQFDDIVHWVLKTFEELSKEGDGVVLCGRRVVADDCGWAVLSRTPTLNSPRDIFLAMRNSSKFLRDIHHQLIEQEEKENNSNDNDNDNDETKKKENKRRAQVELTLARALGGSPVREFRVLLPYRLFKSAESKEISLEVWDSNDNYAGITQRTTDVCFPTLMAWDANIHDENYNIVMRHIRHAKILEKAFVKNARLRTALCQYAETHMSSSSSSISSTVKGLSCIVVLLAVDVIFENLSLPVYLLSATVRCFRHDNEKDSTCTFPFILEDEENEEKKKKECNDNFHTEEINNNNNNNNNNNSNDNMDEYYYDDDDTLIYDSVSFFRLFRDVYNWNHHVEMSRQRVEEAKACKSSERQRFFVIASERSDLVQTKETLAKRGIPLEFMHPELLQGDSNFQKEWREKLSEFISMAQQR